jgi:hypothetical protein
VATPRGGCNPVTFALMVPDLPPALPKSGAVLTEVSGNNQTAERISNDIQNIKNARFAAMSVLLKGQSGKPLVGEPVIWSVPIHDMAVQMDIAKLLGKVRIGAPFQVGGDRVIVLTDENGVATLNKLNGDSVWAYFDDGNLTVRANYGDYSVTFNATVRTNAADEIMPNVSLPYQASIVSGNNQSAARMGLNPSTAQIAPLQIRLIDSYGKPSSGIKVDFRIGSVPTKMITSVETEVVESDSNGIATLIGAGGLAMSCYYANGPFTFIATPRGGCDPVTFDLTVADLPSPTPKPGPILAEVAGNNQTVARTSFNSLGMSSAFFAPMSVTLRDDAGQPLVGEKVTWTVPTTDPIKLTAMLAPSGSTWAVLTDENGVATLNARGGHSVEAYGSSGSLTVKAVYGGTSVTFSATVG